MAARSVKRIDLAVRVDVVCFAKDRIICRIILGLLRLATGKESRQ
jgi:hypothetical protein